jgi:DNA repair protein RecN (Recombination protein N)
MLDSLSVNNFVLIDKLEKNFNKGMTSITGESGSGKSIILDALSLLLGARFEKKFFRKEEKITLIAEFNIDTNEAAKSYLLDLGFDDSDSCIIRRIITKEGKSKSFINSNPCTLTDLKTLGNTLIEIHSQNKNQELFSPENQLKIIDRFADLNRDVSQLQDIFKEYDTKDKYLKDLNSKRESDQSKLQLLNYKYNELKELNLVENEIPELELEQKMLSEAENAISNCQNAYGLCSDDDTSITSLIAQIKKHTETLVNNDNVDSINEMIDSIEINASELSSSLKEECSAYDIDEEKLIDVTNRLECIYTIAKKNHVLPEQLFERFKELESQIKEIDFSDEDLDILYSEIEVLRKSWNKKAKHINTRRIEACKIFSVKVSQCLSELKMEGSKFQASSIIKKTQTINSSGIDDIQFLISSNVGQELQPISQVASGGEVSRINLSIQSLVSNNHNVPTMVFDEVDTGIGGTTANVIGKYLNKISKNSQVLCITHLPQVTVYGDHYMTVKKISNSENAISKIEYINEYELINEIARMIGNDIIDGEAIAQAKKMILNAKEFSNE